MACVCVFVRSVCARVWLSMRDIRGGGGRMPEEVGMEGAGGRLEAGNQRQSGREDRLWRRWMGPAEPVSMVTC